MPHAITHTCRALLASLCFVVLFLGGGQAVAGQQSVLDGQAALALARINEARANPRAAMARLGLAEERVRVVLGAEAWLLDAGLPALAMSVPLAASALAHGEDMLARRYYGYLSPEGSTARSRAALAGYPAVEAEESLVALGFTTYVGLDTALAALVDGLLRDELAGAPGVRRNIFSSEFGEAGVALLASASDLFAGSSYVYLLVVDCARPVAPAQADLHAQGFLLWQRLNEARANPRAVLARLGLPEEQVRAVLGEEAWLLDAGLPPLAWSEALHASALGRGYRLQANFAEPLVVPDPRTLKERLAASGCAAERAGSAELYRLSNRRLETAAERAAELALLLDRQLRDELTGQGRRRIFSPLFSEVGLSALQISAALHPEAAEPGSLWPDIYQVVVDFAQPLAPRPQAVARVASGMGLLIEAHADGSFLEKEELAPGLFQFALPEGGFSLTLLDSEGNPASVPQAFYPEPGENVTLDLRE